MDDNNQDEKNVSEIDMFVEAALKDFLEEVFLLFFYNENKKRLK